MWRELITWLLDFTSSIGEFVNWLFTPIADLNSSLFGSIIVQVTGFNWQYRPIDLLSAGLLTTVLIFLIVKLVNLFV